jgi:hypothetical protein
VALHRLIRSIIGDSSDSSIKVAVIPICDTEGWLVDLTHGHVHSDQLARHPVMVLSLENGGYNVVRHIYIFISC